MRPPHFQLTHKRSRFKKNRHSQRLKVPYFSSDINGFTVLRFRFPRSLNAPQNDLLFHRVFHWVSLATN